MHINGDNGAVQPQWFMSDDAGQYYDAWIKAFDHQPYKLLCNWHVETAWRRQLRKVGDSDLEKDLYKQLKTLMEGPERETFEKLLLGVCNDLKKHNKTREFAILREYMHAEKKQWALCYRSGSGVNTNMYVEAFQCVLKYVYLHEHVNWCLDTLVFILLKFVRDKGFDRLIIN